MNSLKQNLKARLPTMQQIWPVFAIIVFIDFSWVFYRFFYQLPSWLYYMKASNIVILLAYTLSFTLIESLLVLGLVVALCLIYPPRYFRAKFIPQGSLQVIVITILAMALRQRIEDFSKMETWVLIAIPVGVLLILSVSIVIFSYFIDRFSLFARLISGLADRMTIFLYLYPPLGVLGLLLVILRNIF